MGVERKVIGLEGFGGLGVGGVVEQDRTQDGLFRVKIRGTPASRVRSGMVAIGKSVGQNRRP